MKVEVNNSPLNVFNYLNNQYIRMSPLYTEKKIQNAVHLVLLHFF